MSDTSPIIVWFRQDLRLCDNPALVHAAESGKPVLPVFIFDEASPDVRAMGGAQKWWLHHSLVSLRDDLSALGAELHFFKGPAEYVLREIASKSNADALCWNRRYGAGEQNVDRTIKEWFSNDIGEARSFGGLLMHEPARLETKKGDFFRVYTPFWKAFRAQGEVRKPLPRPDRLTGWRGALDGDEPGVWDLLPKKPDWAGTISRAWTPGERGAEESLDRFLADDLRAYDEMRNLPGDDRTSRMSPHLRFGEVSPHQLWHACHDQRRAASEKARETWAKELVWREFSYHLLHHRPDLADTNFNDRFDAFPWEVDERALKAWQKGQTGYPIVDAGMRQLWQTGWMHNRVRMIVGSFLVKHLLIDWREGERWFWDTLVDGDPSSNPAQWQWVAGSGADAAPYFRIFNPMLQGEKFDKNGDYVRRYVPELKGLPPKHIHTPWEAPREVLIKAGVKLGENYPEPIVDHGKARERALDAFQQTKSET